MEFDKNGNTKVVTNCRPVVRWCELEKEMSEEEKAENERNAQNLKEKFKFIPYI